MANKKWCEYTLWVPKYLQELIDLYFFDSEIFKVAADITDDNLKEFLEIILKHFQYYNITISRIWDLGDALVIYFFYKDNDDIEEPVVYPETDRRELTFYILDNAMACYTMWCIMPEDVPFILKCLNAPDEQIIDMYDKLDKYFEQYDGTQRCNVELPRRFDTINSQRIEAIEKNQPIPIKPMGIKIDLCYKKVLCP